MASKNNRDGIPGLPIILLLLIAAALTSLGAIVHSLVHSGNVRSLGSTDHTDDEFYNIVGRSSHKSYTFLDTITPRFNRTKYTFDSFVIAGGIDLAGFGLEDNNSDKSKNTKSHSSKFRTAPSFELFRDFDLSKRLKGNETWIELLEYRRDAIHPSLSFYVDKVAFKRWLVTSYASLKIEGPRTYLLKYASELYEDAKLLQRASVSYGAASISTNDIVSRELLRWLPKDSDYAAKPTHLSCSGGVWLVHNNVSTNTTYVGNGKKKMKAFQKDDARQEIATDLSSNLQIVQEKCGRTVLESHALRHVRPGIVVEERFTQPTNIDNDTTDDDEAFLKGGMEFKVFTIWGRAWLTVWRPGTDGVKALLFRNGTNLSYDKPVKKSSKKQPTTPQPLPEWIDWDRVISIGETLGRHKDMFRTDIFVGVTTSSNQIRYVVSETEIHPTPLRGFETVFEEAGRLWLAGYYELMQRAALSMVPNNEVPETFIGRIEVDQ